MPYVGETDNIKIGLNPLGVRNAGEALFTRLLPGMNNVTLRIRYYSFYCWIVTQFYKGRDKVSKDEFNLFIRKAELLLALVDAYTDNPGGVPGTLFAVARRDESQTGLFDLNEGAALKQRSGTYWANQGGVLSQYYIASLLDMGLFGVNAHNSKLFNIYRDDTSGFVNGDMLADAFQESIGKEAANLFLSYIEKGNVTVEQLKALQEPFGMKSLVGKDTERDLLTKMLLQQDYPAREEVSWHRKRTILYFLEYAAQATEKLSDLDFAAYMYDRYAESPATQDQTSLMWYCFHLNDEWQYMFTQLFVRTLEKLRGKPGQRAHIRELVQEMADEMVESFVSTTVEDALEEAEINLQSKEWDKDTPAYAFCKLLSMVSQNAQHIEASHDATFSGTYSFFRFASDVLMRKSDLHDLAAWLIEERIIYQHYVTAFRKQQATGIASQKFVIDKDYLSFIDTYTYIISHESPRIVSLMNFLTDLQLITENGITELGQLKLEELKDADKK